jgi:eukaryotic translation initiation factor 2C
MNNYPNGLNVMVDLDAEQNRPAGRTSNTFRLTVRPTKTVNLAVLKAWLTGRTSMSEAVLEAMSMYAFCLSCDVWETNSHRLPRSCPS